MDSRELFARYERRVGSAGLPNSLLIRPADANDLALLAKAIGKRSGDPRASDETVVAGLQQELDHPNVLLLVAMVDRELAGYGRVAHSSAISDQLPAKVPEGWYLFGVLVRPRYRRRGIAAELTRLRLAWLARRASEAFYLASPDNQATIDLHERFGFVEIERRPFRFPKLPFTGGVGVLMRAELPVPLGPFA